jgi:hypothetical protein
LLSGRGCGRCLDRLPHRVGPTASQVGRRGGYVVVAVELSRNGLTRTCQAAVGGLGSRPGPHRRRGRGRVGGRRRRRSWRVERRRR